MIQNCWTTLKSSTSFMSYSHLISCSCIQTCFYLKRRSKKLVMLQCIAVSLLSFLTFVQLFGLVLTQLITSDRSLQLKRHGSCMTRLRKRRKSNKKNVVMLWTPWESWGEEEKEFGKVKWILLLKNLQKETSLQEPEPKWLELARLLGANSSTRSSKSN